MWFLDLQTDGQTEKKGGGGRHSSPTSSFPTHGICDSEVPGEISASYLDSTRRRLAAGEFVAGLVFLGTFVLIPLDFCPDGRKQKHIPLCTARLPSLSHKNRKTFSGTQILENYRCRISHPHRVLPPNREMHPAFSFTTLTSTAFYHRFSHHTLHEVKQKPRMTMDRDVGNYQRSSADGLWNNIKPWHLQKMSASSESAVVFHRKTCGTRIAKTFITTGLVKQNGTGKICSHFLTGCRALWWPREVSCFRSQQVSECDKWSNCCFFIQNLETQQTSVNWSIVCGFVTNLSNTRRLCFV